MKHLIVPRSVWFGPMMVCFYFTDSGQNPLYTAAVCACVYATLVVGNYFIAPDSQRKEVKEVKEKKPKEKTPSDKSATGSAKKRN